MRKLISFLMVVVALVATACTPTHVRVNRSPKHVTAQVKQLKPECDLGTKVCKGTYAYRDESGSWLYYYFMFDMLNSNTGTTYNAGAPYSNFGTSLPPGGSWSAPSASAPDDKATITSENVEVPESANGAVITEEQAEVQQSAADNESSAVSDSMNESTTDSGANFDSGSSDSGSSYDSGGSSDSGSSDSGSSGGGSD